MRTTAMLVAALMSLATASEMAPGIKHWEKQDAQVNIDDAVDRSEVLANRTMEAMLVDVNSVMQDYTLNAAKDEMDEAELEKALDRAKSVMKDTTAVLVDNIIRIYKNEFVFGQSTVEMPSGPKAAN